MSKYIFTDKDDKDINFLIKSISSLLIDDVYLKMYKLEIEGRKDTDLYEKLVFELKEKLKLEKNEYEKYNLTALKMIEWRKYLIENKLNNRFNNIESVINLDYKNLNIRRMISILTKKIVLSKENIGNHLNVDKELITFLENIGIDNAVKVVHDSVNYNVQINKSMYNDLSYAFLYIVNILQNEENYYNIKKSLIASKYHFAYTDIDIEDNLVPKKFKIDNNLYISSRIVADLIGVGSYIYEMMKNSYNIDVSVFQINKLINISDLEYSDFEKSISSILRQCLLRASFIMLDDYVINDIYNKFFNYIESKSYLDIHRFDKISKQLLINCFNSVKADKSKTLVLSLKQE